MISVIITTYGRPKYLERAIKSILNGSYKNYEIIVVDDNGIENSCSKETESLIKRLNNNKINYIQHKKNEGANKARNTGIKNSKGEYLSFLDDDDIFYYNKLEEISKVIKKNENIDLIYSGAIFKNEGKKTGKYRFKLSENPKVDILKSNYIGSNSFVVLRKKKINEINGFDESLESCQDWDVWIRVIFSGGKIIGINKPLVEYTIHENENRITSNREKRMKGHKVLFEKVKIYLEKLTNQDKQNLILHQQKIIAIIEYTSGNIEEYKTIIKKIKKDLKMSRNENIKYYLSKINLYFTNDNKLKFFNSFKKIN
ncbi:MAG: glycosyltransferase family 2 protein [Cetobacterium sp.]